MVGNRARPVGRDFEHRSARAVQVLELLGQDDGTGRWAVLHDVQIVVAPSLEHR